MTWLLKSITKALQAMQRAVPRKRAGHLQTGSQGETEAYLFLRGQGYKIVATNFRAPQDHGEIDLIAWDGDTLCFIEVKTRIGEDCCCRRNQRWMRPNARTSVPSRAAIFADCTAKSARLAASTLSA